jgi:hypothetical protein
MHFIAAVVKRRFFFSFYNFYLEREMGELWNYFESELFAEWSNLWTDLAFEDEFFDQDYLYYDLSFFSQNLEKSRLIASSIALDTFMDENDDEKIYSIPDSYHFDSFFFENIFLSLFVLFFFSDFLFYFFFVMLCFLYINLNFSFLENEEETYDIFTSENDLSHYTYTEFEFVEPPCFFLLFYSTDFCHKYKQIHYSFVKKS